MRNKTKKADKTNKWLIIGVGVMIVVIILSFVVPGAISRVSNDGNGRSDDGASQDETEAVMVQFDNQYQLEHSVGETTSDKILGQINQIVSDIQEYDDADAKVLKAVLDETTFRKANYDGGYAYYFDLGVSDGRKYQVYVVTDATYGNGYYGCLVWRVEPSYGEARFEIAMVAEDTEYLKRAEAVEALSNWARGVMPGVKIVMNVNNL